MRAVRLREHSRKETGEEKRKNDEKRCEKAEERNQLISQPSSGQAYRCIFVQLAPIVDAHRDKHLGTTDLRKRRICHTQTYTRASVHCECIYTCIMYVTRVDLPACV